MHAGGGRGWTKQAALLGSLAEVMESHALLPFFVHMRTCSLGSRFRGSGAQDLGFRCRVPAFEALQGQVWGQRFRGGI